jgi:hypothetical protein
MEVECPISCVKSGCDDPPDFLQKHDTFMLTFFGLLGTGVGVLLTYCLRSRCTKIKLCGLQCDREPIDLHVTDLQTEHSPSTS